MPNGGYLRLKLAVDGGRTLALLPPPHDRIPTELVEARIRFQGVAASVFNRKNQILSPLLHIATARRHHGSGARAERAV